MHGYAPGDQVRDVDRTGIRVQGVSIEVDLPGNDSRVLNEGIDINNLIVKELDFVRPAAIPFGSLRRLYNLP